MRSRTLIDSFNCAFEGVVYAFKTQRNIRIHFLAAGIVLLVSLVLKLTKLEILMLLTTIAFVIVTEMINTAIEVAIDMITREQHPLAAIAKNVAAGAVLVASFLAVIVGYLIFFPKFEAMIPRVIVSLQRAPAYLSLIAILLTVVLVVAGKALTQTGTPLQGGMPSGHTAMGATAATTIAFLARNGLIAFLAFFLVLLLAESRLENKVHSPLEVLAGGILGFLITILIFQLINGLSFN